MARLGPQTFRAPDGSRRNVSGPKQADKTLRKVRRALELSSVGVESSTRAHGTETRSYDFSAMSPQDIAAAVGFIGDPLSRELFCLARWPGYADRMPDAMSECVRLMELHILREFGRRYWMAIAKHAGKQGGRTADNPRGRVSSDWAHPCAVYYAIAQIAVICAGGSLPSGEKIAKACEITQPAYAQSWTAVMHWAHEDTGRMIANAEHQFVAAIK